MSEPQGREPGTEAGRRLFTDNYPMDMFESDGVTWDDILAIEAEARQQDGERDDLMRLARIYHAIRHLDEWEAVDSSGQFHRVIDRREVMAAFQPDDDFARLADGGAE